MMSAMKMTTMGTMTAGMMTDAAPLLLWLLPPVFLLEDDVGDDPGDVPIALSPDWVTVAETVVDGIEPGAPVLVVGKEPLADVLDDDEVDVSCEAAVVV